MGDNLLIFKLILTANNLERLTDDYSIGIHFEISQNETEAQGDSETTSESCIPAGMQLSEVVIVSTSVASGKNRVSDRSRGICGRHPGAADISCTIWFFREGKDNPHSGVRSE